MPRRPVTFEQKWQTICQTLQLPEGVYELGDNFVTCTYCCVVLNSVTKRDISRHHANSTHQRVTRIRAQRVQPSENAAAVCSSRKSTFFYDLTDSFISANIPFEKLRNKKFNKFFENYTQQRIPDPTTLRNTYVSDVYEMKLLKIREEIGEHPIYLIVDETTTHNGLLITHAIIGPLLPDNSSIPRMIHCNSVSAANAATMSNFVDESLLMLWPNGVEKNRVLLYITDAAPYMVASGNNLKANGYEKLIHVTCVAHGFHRVAEEIRSTYVNANGVIANTKAVFSKAPNRVRVFHQLAPNIPLPPDPIVTRWGEWLKAAIYYHDYFQQIQPVIDALVDDAVSVQNVKELWRVPDIQEEFRIIHEKFESIVQTITRLETRGLALHESLEVVTATAAGIINDHEIPENIRNRMGSVLMNNSGFCNDLMNIFLRLEGNQDAEIPDQWTIEDVQRMTYAPITSCDVERSFSDLKNIYTKNRNFSVENLKRFVTIYYDQAEENVEEEEGD